MDRFFHKYALYFAVFLFAIALFISANQVFARGKPEEVGSHGSLQQGNGKNNLPHDAISPDPSHTMPPFGRQVGSASGTLQPGKSHEPAFAQVHLQGGKLQACQSMEKNITNRSGHLIDLVTQMEKTFSSIAMGIENYYLTKVVPTGVTLPTYDSLVADITTKQKAVDALLPAVQKDVTDFSCTGNNPGALMTQFRTDMQAVQQGLKEYRTSIKNLIVAVRTLPSISPNPTTGISVTPTGILSVTPTLTPSVTETPTATITPSGTITPTP